MLFLQSLAGKKSNENISNYNQVPSLPANNKINQNQLTFSTHSPNQLSPKILSRLSKNDQSLQPFISNFNDPMVKMLSFDQGNAYKDFKAILQSMKQDITQQKQRNSLIYAQSQNDFKDLLNDLKIQDINVDKIMKLLPKNIFVKNSINTKYLKNQNHKLIIKKKHNQQTFHNYERLLKFSVRQKAKDQYISESSKTNKYFLINKKISHNEQKNKSASRNSDLSKQSQFKRHNLTAENFKIKNKNKNNQNQQKSALKAFVDKKKFQINLIASSTLQNQQQKIQAMMKSRKNCQNILQQALMFQRYFDGMKKDKIRRLQNSTSRHNFTSTQRVKTEGNQRIKTEGNQTKKRPQFRNRNFSRTDSNLSTYQNFANQNLNKASQSNPNPIHIRLQKSFSSNTSKLSQKQHNRLVYVQQLKKKQNYQQMNKISEQIVQKKNYKNNLVIKSIMGFMRQNCAQQMVSIKQIQNSQQKIKQQQNQQKASQLNQSKLKKSFKKSSLSARNSANYKDLKRQSKKNKRTHPRSHIAILPQTLKKLFLLYSNKDSDDLSVSLFSIITIQNLLRFLNDFQIDYELIKSRNEKLSDLLNKKAIDQFEFVQLIHIIAVQITLNKASQNNGSNPSGNRTHKKAQSSDTNNFNDLNVKQLSLFIKRQSKIQIFTQQIPQNKLNPQKQHSPLYTNLHQFLFRHLLSEKYDKYLYLPQNLVYYQRQKLSTAFINKLFKLNKFRQKLEKVIALYLQAQNITSLKLQEKFMNSIQFIVEILWYMKLYPKFINKKHIKFYSQYIKQQLGFSNISTISIIYKNEDDKIKINYKIKGIMVIENIVFLLIAKLAINQYEEIQKNKNNFNDNLNDNQQNITHQSNNKDNQNINSNNQTILINQHSENEINSNLTSNVNMNPNPFNNISGHLNTNQNSINSITFSSVYEIKFKAIVKIINSVIPLS